MSGLTAACRDSSHTAVNQRNGLTRDSLLPGQVWGASYSSSMRMTSDNAHNRSKALVEVAGCTVVVMVCVATYTCMCASPCGFHVAVVEPLHLLQESFELRIMLD